MRIGKTLTAVIMAAFAITACTCSCNETDREYDFPKGKDSTSVNPPDTTAADDSTKFLADTEIFLAGYPEGMVAVAFTDWFDSDSKCVGWYAIADTKANAKLAFKAVHLPQVKRTSEAFAEFAASGSGTPLAAVNGGYWYNGESLSLLVTDSIVKSIAAQAAYLTFDNKTVTAFPVRAAFGQMSGGSFETAWVYCPQEVYPQPYSYPSALQNNEETRTFMANPPRHNNFGATVWTPVEAIGGGPMILKDGEDVAVENYWREILDQGGTAGLMRQPRTAIGATADGKIIFMVCDGRGQNGSEGFTLSEMAQKFKSLGAVTAINLDGGGSSTFVGRDGKVLNRPSDSHDSPVISERKITTIAVIYEKK